MLKLLKICKETVKNNCVKSFLLLISVLCYNEFILRGIRAEIVLTHLNGIEDSLYG